jgi:hypothetical protein
LFHFHRSSFIIVQVLMEAPSNFDSEYNLTDLPDIALEVEDLLGPGPFALVYRGLLLPSPCTSLSPSSQIPATATSPCLPSSIPPHKTPATYKGQPVAVKALKLHRMSKEGLVEIWIQGVRSICKLNGHPNVISTFGYHPQGFMCMGVHVFPPFLPSLSASMQGGQEG